MSLSRLATAALQEFDKAYAALGSQAAHDDHGVTHRRYLASVRIRDVLHHWTGKLQTSPAALVPLLLLCGDALVQANDFTLAAQCCFAPASHVSRDASAAHDAQAALLWRSQALTGQAVCTAGAAVSKDGNVQHSETLEALLMALQVVTLRCIAWQ